MVGVFVFASILLLAVLISAQANRSVLSTAVLFLVAGYVAGGGGIGLIQITPENAVVATLAELALFSILFMDGMRVGVNELVSAWRLPGRALLFGLPLTLVGTALLAHFVAGLSWAESFLLGAILSPTDPVFAAAIVGRKEVPARLRQLLNVESGLNDGLALPVVVAMLAVAADTPVPLGEVGGEVVLGLVLGIVIPWMAIRLGQSRMFAIHTSYAPLHAFAIGLLVLSAASVTKGNEFLAAFAAGITLATIGPEVRQAFHQFGELLAEILKLAALLVFGALLTPRFFHEIPWNGYLFAVLVLILVRPAALALALWGGGLKWREWFVAAWFGPKGFASVVFGLLVLKSGLARANELFHLAAVVIIASIVAHSSTDVLLARWFRKNSPDPQSTSEAMRNAP